MDGDLKPITPTPLDELDEQTRKIAAKAQWMRDQNAELANQIERLGGAVDLGTARMEHFGVALVSMGVLTEEQLWRINLDWERNLRPQLKNMRAELQERVRQAIEAQRREAAQPKLIIPGR